MKKVLVYRSSLLPYSETFIRDQALALRAWHPVLIGRERVADGLPLDGLDVRTFDGDSRDVLQRLRNKASGMLGIATRSLRSAARGASLLHVHFATDAVAAWPVLRSLRLPTLVTLHGYDINVDMTWWRAGCGGRAMRGYPERLMRLSRNPRVYFVAVSEAIRARATASGIPADRICVRYIGVDTSRFAPAEPRLSQRRRRVLFVGRLVEKKGCGYLIEAMARVRLAVPDAELIVIGDGPQMRQCEERAAALDCGVRFLGVLAPDEVRRQMDFARVVCAPSVTAQNGDAEGLPIVICEAQACGIPVVTSAKGGAGEAVRDRVTGFVHGERDVAAIAEHLARLLTDDALLESQGAAARQRATEIFDIGRCSTGLEEAYDGVVNGDWRQQAGAEAYS